MTQVYALGAVLLGGCYLMHERPALRDEGDAGAPDATAPDARMRTVDAWMEIPPPSLRDAGVACEPRPPVAGRTPSEEECSGPVPPGGTTRATLGPHVGLGVATDGCDVWAASAGSGALPITEEGLLWRLGRDGIWRERGGTGMSGMRSHLVEGHDGELHLLVETATSLLHRVYYVGETFGATRVIAEGSRPRLLVPEPIVHRVTARLDDGRLPMVYRTDAPAAIWLTDLATGDEPRALVGPTDAELSMPRICRAGAERLVVVWSEDGRARSAVSDDGGESFHFAPVGSAEDVSSGPTLVDVDCLPDGRALAVWVQDELVRTATLDRQGCWHDTERIRAEGGGFYPHVWISGERAMLSWRVRAGTTYGTAFVDVDGGLVSGPSVDPDANADGHPDRHLVACAREDGFAVMVQGEPSLEGGAGTAHLTVLTRDGELDRVINLGLYGSEPIDLQMACDRHGRSAMFFLDGQAVATSWTPSI